MKKSVLVGLLVLSLAALLAAVTWAWFTHEAGPVVNQFTAGTVEIEIVDNYPPVTNWNPGDTSPKEVSVKNLGTKCVYVRVALIPVWGHIDSGTEGFVAEEALPITNVILNWNEEDWVYSNDWYYYKKILCPDAEETSLLLKSVTLAGNDTGNEYQGKVLQIAVKAEAVQASHEAYKDAWQLSALPAGVEEWIAP